LSGEARTRWVVLVPERLGIAHLTVALHRSKNALPVQDPVEVSG